METRIIFMTPVFSVISVTSVVNLFFANCEELASKAL